MTENPLWLAATLIVPLVMAIVFHEVAHGYVAMLLGDPTARRLGRLSLNPLRHVDPVGTVLLPGLLALTHAPVFGWAKPVPVDARYLRDPRRGMMLVGAAGPAMNFVLAALAAAGMGLAARAGVAQPGTAAKFLDDNLTNFLVINLSLGLFNLLPVPPFDGSHIVEGLLPERLADRYARLRPFGMVLMLVLLLVVPWAFGVNVVAHLIGPPFEWLAGRYLALADLVQHAR
jgi:Zn-dependent protease